MRKKYFTEEERKAARKEANRRWRENHPERVRELSRQWRKEHPERAKEIDKHSYEKNKDKISERRKEYREKNTEEVREKDRIVYNKNKDKKAKIRKKNYEEHKTEILEKNKIWRENNPEKIKKHSKEYDSTVNGRAVNLVNRYKTQDKRHNKGECTLTPQWIIENILSKPCAHCGETDWHKIGCNRLDNSLPHTPDNVEPCCWECNNKLGWKAKSKTVYQYTLDGELIKVWSSTMECKRNGYNQGLVSACCRGERNKYKDCIWSYEPIV